MLLIAAVNICLLASTVWSFNPSYPGTFKPLDSFLAVSPNYFTESCIVITSWNSGLGCNLSFLWWAVGLMKQLNPEVHLYYDHSQSMYQCWANSSLAAFFQPRDDFFSLNDIDKPPASCAVWDMMSVVNFVRKYLLYEWNGSPPETINAGIYQVNFKQPAIEQALIQTKCQVVNSFWNLVPSIRESVDAARSSLFGSKTVVALHIRGGDKAFYGEFMGELDEHHQYRMEAGMHKLLLRYPHARNATCVVLGDSQTYAEETALLAKKLLHCEETVLRVSSTDGNINNETGHFQDAFNDKDLDYRCKSTLGLLEDLEIMSAAHFFIGTPLSNTDQVVSSLRQCLYYHSEDTCIDGSGRNKFGVWT